MSYPNRIRAADMATLLRLANELHDLNASLIERHEHMLRRLATLLGAHYAVSSLVRAPAAAHGRPELLMFVYHGWDDDASEPRNVANRYLRTLEPSSPACAAMREHLASAIRFGDGAMPVTRTRQQLVDDRAWYESDYVQDVHRPMGADHAMFSLLALDGAGHGHRTGGERLATALCVMRPWGERRPFGPRESMILHAFHSVARQVFLSPQPWPSSAAGVEKKELTARQKQVLR
jgi:hypothetical protein